MLRFGVLTPFQQTRNRTGGFGMAAPASNKDQGRVTNKAIGSAFAGGSSAWNAGIWGKNSNTSLKSGVQETGRTQGTVAITPLDTQTLIICHTAGTLLEAPDDETITGSRSLLPLSESDNTLRRHTPWKSMDETSPGLSVAQPALSRASPERRQKAGQYGPPAFADPTPMECSFFSINAGSASVSSRSSQKDFLDPTSRDFIASDHSGATSLDHFSRQNSEDGCAYGSRKSGFGITEPSLSMPSRPSGSNTMSGYTSSVGSRAGSLPPSRGDIDPPSRIRGDVQNLQYARFGQGPALQRTQPSANAPPFIMHTGPAGQRMGENQSPTQLDSLAGQLDQLHVRSQHRRPSHPSSQHSPNSPSDQFPTAYSQGSAGDTHDGWAMDTNEYQGLQQRFSSTSSTSEIPSNQYRSALGGHASRSPSESDPRMSHHSPFYATNETPPNFGQQSALARANHPATSAAQAFALERRLRGLQQQQHQQHQQGFMMPQQNPLQFRNQFSYPYDMGTHQTLRMNPLNSYYPMPPAPHLLTGPQIPRGPSRDSDLAGHLRSPFLEEFRNNGKTNKRYELKVSSAPTFQATAC